MSNDNQTKPVFLPHGELNLMPLKGTVDFTKKINEYIIKFRQERLMQYENEIVPNGYIKDSYINEPVLTRFGTGEGKATITRTVRGADMFIIVDVANFSETYKIFNVENHMSPDDHYSDLKRVIAAANGKAKRINVIMPFMYESRQHKRSSRESLDCAIMLQELEKMGIKNFITIDAHDPRIMNSIPLSSFDTINCTYQFINALLNNMDDLKINPNDLMIISPDSGAMQRSIYYANVLGIDLGMFYKRRDYTRVVDGKNPIVAHEFLGNNVEGKDVIIIDDMIASGDSLFDTARELKKRKANRIIACCTFGLFTTGFEKFDEAYKSGLLYRVLTTNCIYQQRELFNKEWYISVDVTEYLARIIDCINHDISISGYLDPLEKIHQRVNKYKGI